MILKLPPISAICSVLLGGTVAFVSTASFVIDMINTRNIVALAIDIIIMAISYLTVWQGINYAVLDRRAKKNQEDAFDNRVKPLIQLLTETVGKVNALEEDVLKTNLMVKTTLDYVTKAQNMDASKMMILPGASFKFISKILVLIMFTFSALVYVSSYPLGMVHYFIAGMYVAWWAVITAEYKLFGNTKAWIWAISPILIIPTTGIVMSAVYGLNIMIGILFLFLFIYVYSYYTWASYLITGYKLLDLKPVVFQIRQKFGKKQEVQIDIEELRSLTK